MLRKLGSTLAIAAAAVAFTGCAHLPGGTDLGKVSKDKGMRNITTGDGTFENYKATGHHTGTEVGLAFGIPFLCKIAEVYPKQTNEAQVGQLVDSAKKDGANALINVKPPQESYYGIPFLIFGLYVDSTEGTGIKAK